MMQRTRISSSLLVRAPVFVFLTAALPGCAREAQTPTSPGLLASASAPLTGGEGELLGNVYINGQYITDSSYYVTLAPLNQQTASRLRYFSGTMWVSPTHHDGQQWMFSWIDPRNIAIRCGNEAQYVSGDTLSRLSEVHWSDPATQPTGKEKHCIQPGQYRLEIDRGAQPVKILDIDYVPGKGAPGSYLHIWNSTAGVYELIEGANYDDTAYAWQDVIVDVDVGTPNYSHSSVLYGDSAGSDPYALTTFTDTPSLGGNQYTWFRFSSVASTSSFPLIQGRLLSRLYWDATYHPLTDRSGFWDSHSAGGGVIRIHQFRTDSQRTGVYAVGLETMPPDRQPASAPDVTRPVNITLAGPPPSLTDAIAGPDLITVSGTYNWVQTASGGIPPYDYGNWYYYRTPGPESVVGSGQSYSRYVSTKNTQEYIFRLRALVTDQDSGSAQMRIFVDVVPGGGGGAAPASGVRLPDGSCGPRPASGPARQAWLEWVVEQRAGVVEACPLPH